MRAWVADRFGKPSEVLTTRDVEMPEVGDGDLLVKVEAATLNNNDLDAIWGRWATLPVPAPFVPGLEVLGTVEACGPGTEDWTGRRVVGMPRGGFGGYAEYAVLPRTMAFQMPTEMPTAEAAAIFWPFHLAWLCLFTRGGLREAETVMVHSAAGGAGSAAVQLAVGAGARVIATVGSDEKLAICRELGAETAINYRSEDLVAAVREATGGAGVDVAFDGTGGDLTELTWQCMGFGGRHVIFGFSSGIEQTDEARVSLRQPIFGNFSLVGALSTYVDHDRIVEETGLEMKRANFNFPSRQLGEEIHGRLLELLERGRIRPVVDREVPFAELPEAIDAFERREIVGRVVVHV